MSKTTTNSLIALGSAVAGLLIYESCCKCKNKPKVKKIKKSVCREIELGENSSIIEKAIVINKTGREIVESLYKKEVPGYIIKSIRFSVNTGINDEPVQICGDVQMNCMMLSSKAPGTKKVDPDK